MAKQNKPKTTNGQQITRRDFVKASGAVIASAVLFNSLAACSAETETVTETAITTATKTETATATTTTTAAGAQTKTTAAATTTAPTTVAPAPRIVTDITGRAVTIPAVVNKVAAIYNPVYDSLFMLGASSKICVIGAAQNKWAQVLNPLVAQIPVVSSMQNPNIEDLIARNADVVFPYPTADSITAMINAGLVVVSTGASQAGPMTADECTNAIKANVQLFAKVMGAAYQAKADDYCKYVDDIVTRVTAVSSKIPANQRLSVYYVRGPAALTAHGAYTNTRWWVELAGGNFVTKEVLGVIINVTMEQVINWNPDVIFMGRSNTTALIMNDPKWSGIKAVRNWKTYVNPQGEFYWDSGVEGPLLMLFAAKMLYPDRFADIDMAKELKSFYSRFFGYTLTDDQANRIINFQDPQ